MTNRITDGFYQQYEEFAKKNGFKNVAEAASHYGAFEFKRRFRKNFNSRKITIELKGGKWLVNNKLFRDCSDWEKDFMNRFFQEVRTENLI